jgi:hypothetical protein
MKRGEVNLTEGSLTITAEACLSCGALIKIRFDTDQGPVEIDNIQLHQAWHWTLARRKG